MATDKQATYVEYLLNKAGYPKTADWLQSLSAQEVSRLTAQLKEETDR